MSLEAATVPRWGSAGRERKAAAIRGTLARALGRAVDGGCWVDIGCGSGGIAAALVNTAESVLGIDPEPWPQWSELAAHNPGLHFVSARCDGHEPPLPAASADVLICNQVYEHVGDPRKLLRNIAHILRPDGVCYFAGPNLLWPIEPHVFWPFVHWLPRRFAQSLMRRLGSRRWSELDAFSTTSWRLEGWMAEAGLVAQPALRERLLASEGSGIAMRLARAAARIVPNGIWRGLRTLSPGLVYVVRRADRVPDG